MSGAGQQRWSKETCPAAGGARWLDGESYGQARLCHPVAHRHLNPASGNGQVVEARGSSASDGKSRITKITWSGKTFNTMETTRGYNIVDEWKKVSGVRQTQPPWVFFSFKPVRQARVAPILARQIPSTLVADNFMSPLASPEATSLVPKMEA